MPLRKAVGAYSAASGSTSDADLISADAHVSSDENFKRRKCCCLRGPCRYGKGLAEVSNNGNTFCCRSRSSYFSGCWWNRVPVGEVADPSQQYDDKCKLQCRQDCGADKRPDVVVDGPKQSCGCRFAGVVNPFQRKSRIAIVGAGPAGVHLASRLKQLGYMNLTLLERTGRVGGKSYTIYLDENGQECTQSVAAGEGTVDTTSCVAHEVGSCFLHNGYRTVRNLIEEYRLTPEVEPVGRAVFSRYAADKWHAEELSRYIEHFVLEVVNNGSVGVPFWARMNDALTVIAALLDAVEGYNELHKEIFGNVEFSMAERPSIDKLRRINMTFSEFLTSNHLHALVGFLEIAQTAQGYGYIQSIPAFYGLSWVTPELLNGYIQMSLHDRIEAIISPNQNFGTSLRDWWVHKVARLLVGGDAESIRRTTTMLPEGYGRLWTKIVEQEKLDVRFQVEITAGGIERQADDPAAPVRITYSQAGGPSVTEEYDFLIYTGPHAHAHKYVADLSAFEASLFSKLQSYVLSATLYKSDSVASFTDASSSKPLMFNAEKVRGPDADGGWYADRYDALIHSGLRQDRQVRVGYQFFQDACTAEPEMCDSDRVANPYLEEGPRIRAALLTQLEEQRVTNVEIIKQFPWPYFHHFPAPEVARGVPWDIVDMQGLRKTWWLGASAFFESVHDVTNYNLMIMKRYLGAMFVDGRPA